LLIDSRVHTHPYIDCRKSNVDYIIFNYYTDTFNSLCDKIESNKYNQIGLVQHADFNSGFNILRKETVGSNDDTPPYTTFNPLVEFMTKLKSKGVHTFDFLGCELYDPVKTPAIFTYLEGASGVDLRASTNLTGSAPGDWIMESDNVNIKSIYWTDKIDQYKGTLDAYSYFFDPVNSTTLASTIKDIDGNLIYLYTDINGNPINPTIDLNGDQIKNEPSQIIFWGGIIVPAEISIRTDIVAVYYNRGDAYAALTTTGDVVTWGDQNYGGDSSTVDLTNIIAIYNTDGAFAAIKNVDGVKSVVTWGHSDFGGNSSSVALDLSSNVVSVYSTPGAFAALKTGGAVVTWGDPTRGGIKMVFDIQTNMDIDVTNDLNADVVTIYSNQGGFAALKSTGSVVIWGSTRFLNVSTKNAVSSDIKVIYSTTSGFVAIKKLTGQGIFWGDIFDDEASYTAINTFLSSDIIKVYSNVKSTIALKSNGDMILWSVIGESHMFSNIAAVYFETNEFIYLRTDGTLFRLANVDYYEEILYNGFILQTYYNGIDVVVCTSGKEILATKDLSTNQVTVIDTRYNDYGVDFFNPTSKLSGVVAVYSTRDGIAVLKSNGNIVTWGRFIDPFIS